MPGRMSLAVIFLSVMTLLGKDAEQYAGPSLFMNASVSGNFCREFIDIK